jgi:hypothetical protein
MTNPVDQIMRVPMGESEMERTIRAHELMHTKISPAEDWAKWVKRGIASTAMMVAVEEVRVNYGIEKVGFDLDCLTDGCEDADGEWVAIHNDWANAVMFAIGTAHTGGGKKFLVGVRRHNKQWAKALQSIQKRVWSEMLKADGRGRGRRHSSDTSNLFSTKVAWSSDLSPTGFFHTERIAEWADRLAKFPPKRDDGDGDERGHGKKRGTESSKRTTGDDEETPGREERPTTTGAGERDGSSRAHDKDADPDLDEIEPHRGSTIANPWGNLVWGKVKLDRPTRGRLGRTRVAAQYGKSPRRIQRLLTDPHKRVFDRKVRGAGGIVLIDASGSMSMSRDDVMRIITAAPGATVAMYSDNDRCGGEPNIWVVAKDGKMVKSNDEMPPFGHGNSVDLPALEWAVKNRKRNEPIVWVTDGVVCSATGHQDAAMVISCYKTCVKGNVLIVKDNHRAAIALKALNSGQTLTKRWPPDWSKYLNRGGYSRMQEVKKR